jgi:uncharacterized protein (TIGR03437 family)
MAADGWRLRSVLFGSVARRTFDSGRDGRGRRSDGCVRAVGRVLLCAAAWTVGGWCQKPVITPGGVVSAATYATGIGALSITAYPQTGGGPALASGSVASIFGANLAASTVAARALPLPLILGGTSVSVNGVAAPLFFVSPTQINFQVPTSAVGSFVVSTAAGQSDPYALVTGGLVSTPGIFTLNSSGCGPGAVLNVAANGNISYNSPANSSQPGDYIAIYGTGNGYVSPTVPDGAPAPSSPLARASVSGGPLFDFSAGGYEGSANWAGRAPGLVGVDQFNFIVPTTARQGCAVPLQFLNGNLSPPVTISIANGGGACADPPTQGYGDIVWAKTITTDAPVASSGGATQTITEADTVTMSLQASPGRQAPTAPVFTEGGLLPGSYTYFGTSCAVPGYRSLGAGTVTVSGPGIAPITAPPLALQGSTVINVQPQGGFTLTSQVQSGQVTGLTEYQATLPSGAIQPGTFTVAANGGPDVGGFQSSVQVGSPIQVTTALAGIALKGSGPAFTINWTGGDPNAWVTLELLSHAGSFDYYPLKWVARASDGQLTIHGSPTFGFQVAGTVEIVMEVVPDPSNVSTVSAPGLSLGGRALWKYTYRFEGVTVQ